MADAVITDVVISVCWDNGVFWSSTGNKLWIQCTIAIRLC